MKTSIEITGLTPKIDPKTMQMSPWVLMWFRREDGRQDQFDMAISQMELMTMLNIQNLSEAVGQKYEMETDGTGKILSMVPKDTRQVSYSDFMYLKECIERIERKLGSLTPNQPKKPQT